MTQMILSCGAHERRTWKGVFHRVVIATCALFCAALVGGGCVGLSANITIDDGGLPEFPDGPAGEVASNDAAFPAPHPPLPQIEQGFGSVPKDPIFIPITFENDPSQSDIAAFTSGIGTTSYWSTITAQYGLGSGTSGKPVILSKTEYPAGTGSTVDDGTIQSWLQAEITSGVLAGTNSTSTIYAVYFPEGTTITVADGLEEDTSCVQFFGYHSNFEMTTNSTNVTYVVVPRCGTVDYFPSQTLSGIDAITGPASHEYLEAATNPTGQGYNGTDPNDYIWSYILPDGEIADMCLLIAGPYLKPADFPYLVQRAWSNSAAASGNDPCQPEPPGEVYINSVAALPVVQVEAVGSSTQALNLNVGESATVNVDLYSDAPTSGPWEVEAKDGALYTGGGDYLGLAWDKTTGENGGVLHLTVTLKAAPPIGYDGFVIFSKLGSEISTSIGMVAQKQPLDGGADSGR